MIDTALHFLFGLPPEQFIRTFWLLILVEVPRFFVSYAVVIGAWLFGRERGPPVPPAGGREAADPALGVSVLVPAHNDADSVARTVISLREQPHRPLEIIVADDGSTDATASVCRRLERQGMIDRYVRADSRGGKSSALNTAFSLARQPVLLLTDADTTFDRDAVAVAVEHFRDPDVGAVGGTLRVRNADATLVTRLQQINYFIAIMAGRLVNNMLGFFFVGSGAFSMYRRTAVSGVGGWDFGPGEDGDMMVRLRLAGWTALFEPHAVCRTIAPESIARLIRQRVRWNRSLIRNRFRKARRYALVPRQKAFDGQLAAGMVDGFIFTALIPFLFLVYLVDQFLLYGIWFIAVLLAVQIMYVTLQVAKYLLLLALSPDKRTDLRYLPFVPLYTVANVYLLRWVRLYAVVNELVFRGSYKDPFVPAKVRRQAPRY
ncbi:bi-functional transferase/deacetylase [Caenispirillum salinarum AK4]|uniref:Bi-functional transferase/deacetylase n=1 Tax=Caenispirillum salinarum AK4 TaxID=1238182 RepID=K9GUY0_9PROT|nr:glycosyltransferase [Caenispirillum salinarum]EKV29795.1 bi-functional transferase/deacetylase [Caenispirillum salinarum AK4]